MTASIQLSIDKDALLTAISSAADLIRTMDMVPLSQECQEILLAAMQLQAATARACNVATASNPASPPPSEFPYSQEEAARIVCGAFGLNTETFRKNQPWLLLKKKHLGEGVGFTSRPTKNRRGVTRDYSQNAVDFLMKQENWEITRWELDQVQACRTNR